MQPDEESIEVSDDKTGKLTGVSDSSRTDEESSEGFECETDTKTDIGRSLKIGHESNDFETTEH